MAMYCHKGPVIIWPWKPLPIPPQPDDDYLI